MKQNRPNHPMIRNQNPAIRHKHRWLHRLQVPSSIQIKPTKRQRTMKIVPITTPAIIAPAATMYQIISNDDRGLISHWSN